MKGGKTKGDADAKFFVKKRAAKGIRPGKKDQADAKLSVKKSAAKMKRRGNKGKADAELSVKKSASKGKADAELSVKKSAAKEKAVAELSVKKSAAKPKRSGHKGKADAELSVKKSAAKGNRPAMKGKSAKDPNKPKRYTTSFFVFMEEFRKTYQEKHPENKSVAAASKAGREKWRSMTDAEKEPFLDISLKRKVDFLKERIAYNRRWAHGASDNEEQGQK